HGPVEIRRHRDLHVAQRTGCDGRSALMQTVWDPIDGHATVAKPAAAEYTSHPLSGLVRNLTVPMLLVCLSGFCVAVFSETWRFYGIGAATVGFLFIMFGSELTGQNKNLRARIANATGAAGHLGGTKLTEGKIAKLAARIKPLLVLRVGGSIPIILEHEIWGHTRSSVPFWMGLSLIQSHALFGGPKAAARADPKTTHGEMASFIVAYRLDRDTRIHAEIMPEFATAMGPLDTDVKTESTEFNAKFNIRLRTDNGQAVAKGVSSSALLQVLTPATQSTLIALADTYAARVIVDRDTVFFGGYRNFPTTDQTALERLLTQAIEDFAEAATAFKRYVE
ncbi:MAG: hypothetical protein AAFY31_08745, partial [Pseudomonadota bacterium]